MKKGSLFQWKPVHIMVYNFAWVLLVCCCCCYQAKAHSHSSLPTNVIYVIHFDIQCDCNNNKKNNIRTKAAAAKQYRHQRQHVRIVKYMRSKKTTTTAKNIKSETKPNETVKWPNETGITYTQHRISPIHHSHRSS